LEEERCRKLTEAIVETADARMIVVQLPLSESTDFDEPIDIENRLTLSFLKDRAAAVDGHALAGGNFNIFIMPHADPGAIIDRIKASLAESGVLDEAIIARRRSAQEAYSVVWPHGYRGTFEL
jgi:hypothetical protein